MNDFFSVGNFNVIEDEDNYYYFRALETSDLDDELGGKLEKINGGFNNLRTYRERYNEVHSIPSRYKEDDEISLDEVYSHIKKNFYPGTNCISFSTNCNVSLDYGYGNNRYVMIRVPKKGLSNVYSGGQYMLNELNNYLENVISGMVNEDSIISIIRNMEQVESNEELLEIINEQVNNFNGNSSNLLNRFLPKQFFNFEQQLAYNKIIGKLTLLEISGNVKNVLPRTQNNQSLISTISMAYSSGEIINYGNVFPNKVQSISKTSIELFALLQQAEDMGIDKGKVKLLKEKVLDCVKQGFDLRQYGDKIGYGNEKNFIEFTPTFNSILMNESNLPFDKEIFIYDAFRVTEGRISYKKTKDAVDFAYNLGVAKEKNYELCELLKAIVSDSSFNDVIDDISKNCYCINAKVINRRNMSGLKICESVNIDMNSTRVKVYSNDEQQRMISYISKLSRDNLRELILSSGLSIEKRLYERILSSDEPRNINRYYAETIVDQIDFESIYGEDRIITDSEKDLLVSKVESLDCVKIYSILKKYGFSDNKISNCVINLLIENGFKDYKLDELIKLENLDDLLKANISNLNYKVSAIGLDKVLGIFDNNNIVEGSRINLRDYQQDAVDTIDSIFEEKRFAGVILPTGAGKSFVAMAEMLKNRNKNILYYAPNIEILNQITKHIMKHILNMSNEEIQELYDKHQPIPNGKFLPPNIEERLKLAFPHLKLYCYQGLVTKDDDFFDSHDADLIIFDELHRAGATEWNKKIKRLIEKNPKAHLLGITATPIRDVDRQDMMLKFAELSGDYSKSELIQKKYLASELYLIDAMQEGILVVPNIVSFDYSLEDSEQYKEIKTMLEIEKDSERKAKIKTIYDEMRQIIEHSKKKGMASIIKESFEKNSKRKNGRYIVFLPINSNPNISTEQYMQEEIEKVKQYFSLIDTDPEVGYLLSDRKNKSENSVAMSNFEKDSDHLKLIFAINMLNEGVHVDGIDGIVMLRPIGANTKILYNQQTGRCVFSLNPNISLNESEVPLIFDVYNNYLEQNMDREVNKSNSTSDLQKMRSAVYWIKKHRGYFPDINSLDVGEYRKALTLKKIQIKYSKFLESDFGDNLTPSEQYEIEEILSLGSSINLWDRIIPDREVEFQVSKDIERINTFKATGETKRFLELYKEAKKDSKTSTKVGSLRLRTAISTLELLSEYGININNNIIKEDTILQDLLNLLSADLLFLVKNEMEDLQISGDYPIGVEYNFAKQMFYSKNPVFLEYSLRTLRTSGIFYPFVNGKGSLVKSIDDRGFIIKGRPEFINLNIYTGSYYDIDGYDIEGYDELFFKDGEGVYNKYGFDRNGIHYKTKTKLNCYGFDLYGNYNSKNEDGTYCSKGKYDDRGFNIDGLWFKEKVNKKTGKIEMLYTGSTYDADGFDRDGIDINHFGRNGNYYILDSNKNYVDSGRKTDEYGFIQGGIHLKGTKYDDHGFDINGVHLNGTYKDNYGFYRNGFSRVGTDDEHFRYINGFDIDGIFKDTNMLYNFSGFDRDGFFWEKQSDGTRIKTDEKFDELGFDFQGLNKITRKKFDVYGKNKYGLPCSNLPQGFYDFEGVYWKLQRDLTFKKTQSIYDKYGFDKDGNNKNGTKYDDYGFDVYGFYKNKDTIADRSGGNYQVDGYGFDRDGFYWEYKNYKKVKVNSLIDKYQFDRDGFYWEKLDNGTYKKTDSLYNLAGFDCFGFHKITGKRFDEYGNSISGYKNKYLLIYNNFDEEGNYWEKQSDGKLKNIGKYNSLGFDRHGIHKDTGEEFDEYGKTNKGRFFVDEYGRSCDVFGYFYKDRNCWEKQSDGKFKNIGKYNSLGFDYRGINKDTGMRYDSQGRQENGSTRLFDSNNGFDDYGVFWRKNSDGTYSCTNLYYNDDFFDFKGNYWKLDENGNRVFSNEKYNDDGFDINGIHKDTHKKYNREGRNIKNEFIGFEYDERGFDINGNNKNGTRYDDRGFDSDGIYKDGSKFNDYGFTCDGFYGCTDLRISDKRFDIDGFYHRSNLDGESYNYYDNNGFDIDGFYWEKLEDGTYKKTDRKFDSLGFDRDGFYWEKLEDGTYVNTNRRVTNDGFDKNGFDKDGIHYETKLDYDKHFFRKNGINIYTNDKYDINGFDINGLFKFNNSPCNNLGFDRDGIHCITNTRYDSHGLDIYRNPVLDLKDSKSLPYEVFITKSYVDRKFLIAGVSKEFYQTISKKFGCKSIEECDKKISQLLFKGFCMCPELKKPFLSQLSMLKISLVNKKRELKKLDSSVASNKMKIEKLKKEIDFYERRESTFSTYK